MAKQRVSQFKKIENQKLLKELKVSQENKKKQIDEEHKKELENFNDEMDRKLYDLNERYEEDQKALFNQHENEINARTEEFNKEYPLIPKQINIYIAIQKLTLFNYKLVKWRELRMKNGKNTEMKN